MTAPARKRRTRRVAMPTPESNGVVPSVYVGRLQTASDWARELSRLYRQMRRGEVPVEVGTRLAFVGRIAAMAAKLAQEIAELGEIRAQLSAIQQGKPLPPAQPFDGIDTSHALTLLDDDDAERLDQSLTDGDTAT